VADDYAKILGVRDDVVIATKYTANVHDQQVEKYPNQINRSGNSVKSMMVSLEASLKKLGTTYIDVFCESCTVEGIKTDDGRHALVGLDYSHRGGHAGIKQSRQSRQRCVMSGSII